jgi:hypothetical protein
VRDVGIVDRDLKELGARYLAGDEVLMELEGSDRFDDRGWAACAGRSDRVQNG